MDKYAKKQLGESLQAIGILVLEVFEIIFSAIISLRFPGIIGTVTMIIVLFLTLKLNLDSPDNYYMHRHHILFKTIFGISAVIAVLGLLYMLILVSPIFQH